MANHRSQAWETIIPDGGRFPITTVIGPHGHGPAEVTPVDDEVVDISLESWVDEEGYGDSATGELVKKEFPGPVVIFEGLDWDFDRKENMAERAYVGEIIQRVDGQTIRVSFDEQPPQGVQDVTFSPEAIHDFSESSAGQVSFVERDVEEIREELREIAGDSSLVTDGGQQR